MSSKHDINTYSKLAEASNFYLNESFRHIDNALLSELISVLFQKKLDKIDITKTDRKIISKIDFPENDIDLLQKDIEDVLSEDTTQKLAEAWFAAQTEAQIQPQKFPKKHIIHSIELLGHVNSLAFFLETLINRHLLFLHQTKVIDNFSYNNLTTAKTLNRLIYICKPELESNKLQLNEIANLFTLRNKAVHYTPDNAASFQTDIAALIRIWEQIHKLLKIFEKKEKFIDNIFSQELASHVEQFKKNWTP